MVGEFQALEIGAGRRPVNKNWDRLDAVEGRGVTFVADWGVERLPVEDGSYHYVFASHVLEHVAWYRVRDALAEVLRILKRGGYFETWQPNAYKIAQAIVEMEEQGRTDAVRRDRWRRFRKRDDVYGWAAGRMFSYGDGSGGGDSVNWHRGLFTPKSLTELLREVGFEGVCELDAGRRLGRSHGWIEFGVLGRKG